MNSDRFLQAFNRTEKHLRREAQEDRFVSFGALVAEMSAAEVLEHAEDETHVFMGRNVTQLDVLKAFESPLRTGKVLSAPLLNHSGRAHEKIIGIVTASDLPTVSQALEPSDRGRG